MKKAKKTKPSPESEGKYTLKHRVRVVTAASLFDGHDAAVNIMRRILQSTGAEVIHLGHNRSVGDIVRTAVQEDAQAIALSSYQGGHNEYFRYMIDLLKPTPHIQVFGGGGGTITPDEIKELEAYGVTRIYSPEDGRKMGLQGLINDILQRCDHPVLEHVDWKALQKFRTDPYALAQAITCLEMGEEGFQTDYKAHLCDWKSLHEISKEKGSAKSFVLGITGTGGAGKSSLTDELILRILESEKDSRVAVLAIDPTRRKTGGALLGDRLRMNSLKSERCYMRSMATRQADAAISESTAAAVGLLKAAEFDWIIVETGGIGQADASIVDLVDASLYVMTSEYGASTQLEKINMLDYAQLIAINKFEKAGSADALKDVRKQFRRNHLQFEHEDPNRYPIFGTIASRFADSGVDALFEHLRRIRGAENKLQLLPAPLDTPDTDFVTVVPRSRNRYLSEIVETVRGYKKIVESEAYKYKEIEGLELAKKTLSSDSQREVDTVLSTKREELNPELSKALATYEQLAERYHQDNFTYQVRDRSFTVPLTHETLSHNKIRRVATPNFLSKAELVRFVGLENLPGYFPFTAGVFPFKRTEEEPKRMFAGEGTPTRTNKRFHYLCDGERSKRLSTAFDSVTLYGEDPHERPDIYGKIGESGVSVCSLDDAKKLYAGFDLCDPSVSVSMTINGPAPMLLAFYFNTAIDQQVERFEKEHKRKATPEEKAKIQADTLTRVRGTVQADILKEDQAQNTCIFSTPFALRMMGDIQQYFVDHNIRNYYSVSISGYHIAEAGANPISQVAFTLANGFTFVEYYLARGMPIDAFAPNLSFFFSNALDPEYAVIGRVARRIWSIAMKNLYKGNERSQKLKYHIQTSGRSLHAQEIAFNDIRTTLQALNAYYDNCNSLHTNAYDEAITTPTEESVRRAMAIQLIIAREFGVSKNENPLQGSYFMQELTDLVEEAILSEFERLSARGGVLGAMEGQYQRNQIQEESLHYERQKHSGELPLVGINTFLNPNPEQMLEIPEQLTRASYAEKNEQIENLRLFQKKHAAEAPAALEELKAAARAGKNIFEALMTAARVCSLGQLTNALYSIGGEYRRAV
ncbi:MAG: methylmalonyl-CoA mutase family protein [Bdellovibrionales bacterium]|nr:methylmalonyl-CoA mutase family protein [Bdellovibrionales bacterium]